MPSDYDRPVSLVPLFPIDSFVPIQTRRHRALACPIPQAVPPGEDGRAVVVIVEDGRAQSCPHHQVRRTRAGQTAASPGGPLKRGSRFCCMICHQSGQDHKPYMQRSAKSDPKPEKKPVAAKKVKLTRKELRALKRDYKVRESTLSGQERDYLRRLGVEL